MSTPPRPQGTAPSGPAAGGPQAPPRGAPPADLFGNRRPIGGLGVQTQKAKDF